MKKLLLIFVVLLSPVTGYAVVDTTIQEGDSLIVQIGLGSDSTFVERGDTLYSYVVVDSGLKATLFWKTEIGYYPTAPAIKVYERKTSDSTVIDSFLYNVAFTEWNIVDTFLVDTLISSDFPYIVDGTKSNDSTWTILKLITNITVNNPTSTAAAIQIRTTAGERVKVEICPTCTLFVNASTMDQDIYGIHVRGLDATNGHDVDSVIIEGGTIILNAAGSTTEKTTDQSACVYGSKVTNFMMIDVNCSVMDTGGVGGFAVLFDGVSSTKQHFTDSITDTSATGAYRGAWNVLILRGTYQNNATRYLDRQQDMGSVIEFIGARPWDSLNNVWPQLNADYHIKVEGVTIANSPNRGMNLQGRVHVINCHVTINAQNPLYERADAQRGMTKTRSGVLDSATTGALWDSAACYNCAAEEQETGRRVWNGSSWNAITGFRSSTLSTASGVNGGSGQDSVWVDDWNTKTAIGNPYAIQVSNGTGRQDTTGNKTYVSVGADHGSRIEYNTLRTSDSQRGGYGILLQHPEGTPTDKIYIVGNDAISHQARTAQSNQGYTMRIRWGGDNVVIYKNSFENIVDDRANTDTAGVAGAYEYEGKALQITGGDISGENSGQLETYSILYNTLTVSLHTGSGKNVKGYALNIDNYNTPAEDTLFDEVVMGNILTSPYAIVGIGQFDGGGRDVDVIGNKLITPSLGDTADLFSPIKIGQNGKQAYNNIFKDNIFTGAGLYTDIVFGNPAVGDTHFVHIKNTITVTVNGNDASPVAGATVWGINQYNQSIAMGTTDANGQAALALPHYFLASGAITLDSTAYNPYTFWGKKLTDSASDTLSVLPTTSATIITLANTAGGGGGGSSSGTYVKVRK